jgi:tetratricopeptide (TPR) repeat protein
MNSAYDWEDIDDYVQGSMSEADSSRFEEAMAADAELARRVAACSAEPRVNRLLRNAYLLEQMRAWDKEQASPQADSHWNGWGSKGKMLWLVLLLIAVVLMVYWQAGDEGKDVQKPAEVPTLLVDSSPSGAGGSEVVDSVVRKVREAPPKNLAAIRDNVFMEEDFLSIRMGGSLDESTSSQVELAAVLYTAGQYEEALGLLQLADSSCRDECLYLKGYTLYKLGRYAAAEAAFRTFRNYTFSARKFDAQWCEVFCMVAQLPEAQARLESLLKELATQEGHPYRQRAGDLLKKLAAGR